MEEPLRGHRALYKAPGLAVPPWKETYRRRCAERLRSGRAKLLERYRRAGAGAGAGHGGGTGPGALLVPEVMELEWRSLQAAQRGDAAQVEVMGECSRYGRTADCCAFQMLEDPHELAVLDEIQQELILQEQLVIEEYEQSLQFDEECLNAMLDGLDASNKIICPVCRKNTLTVSCHSVFCQCGLYILTRGMTEQKLRALLENTLTEHSYRCFHNPEFTVTGGMEEETSLLMTCPVCDSWTVLL
uniref:RPA interacting protein n=1 Tax=Anser brachyrhynchus TaxID=132585 RepID=A0A8B9BZF2_9AVES